MEDIRFDGDAHHKHQDHAGQFRCDVGHDFLLGVKITGFRHVDGEYFSAYALDLRQKRIAVGLVFGGVDVVGADVTY